MASSGTRLNMTSHSEAPNRGKCMPASARRYCPVMVQVHSLWMLFISFIRYMRRAPLSPRDGIEPRRSGRAADEEAAQQRGHDDGGPSGDERVKGQVPDDLEQRRHLEICVRRAQLLRAGMKPRANQKMAAGGDHDETRRIGRSASGC